MPTQNALPDAVVRRFRNDVEALTGPLADSKLMLAVSGGGDSLGMLLLAHAAYPGQIAATTVDHRLRPASAHEAAFVATLCAHYAIPHAIVLAAIARRGNLSDEARRCRYQILVAATEAQHCAWLLTAHHADDQLETMIMRLNRGSGVAGLAGIRARQGPIIRPLLNWQHDELVAIVRAAHIEPVDDPSNGDARFDRARLRKALLTTDWLDPLAAARSAAALADAEAALEWSAGMCEQLRVVSTRDAVMFDVHGQHLPAEIVRRIVVRCIQRIDPDCHPRGEALTRLISTLTAGRAATIGNVIAQSGALWTFGPAPPRRVPNPR